MPTLSYVPGSVESFDVLVAHCVTFEKHPSPWIGRTEVDGITPFCFNLTLGILAAPVHDAAATPPLRSVNTNGAKATAPPTRRRRLLSGADSPPASAVSSVSDDKSGEAFATSSDAAGALGFMVQLPRISRIRCGASEMSHIETQSFDYRSRRRTRIIHIFDPYYASFVPYTPHLELS